MVISQRSRLDSWKEIADYLGREVRTVIRWEKEKNLPVHRVPGGKRRPIFAYTDEIDHWLGENEGESLGQPGPPTDASRTASRAGVTWGLRGGLMVLAWGLILLLVISSEWRAHPSGMDNSMQNIVPHDRLDFGRLETGLPWQFQGWSLMDVNGESIVAFAVGKPEQWKSMVLLANAQEQILGRFVYEGRITTLSTVHEPKGPLLLVGGASHSVHSGAVAALDVSYLLSSSPKQSSSAVSCNGCSPGRPVQYFVFLRSELNRVAGSGPNRVEAIEISKQGIKIRTAEMISFGKVAEGVYEFSLTLKLRKASFNDTYWDFHRELELAGKIHHPKKRCPDRFGPTYVQSWNTESGWVRLQPPRITSASR